MKEPLEIAWKPLEMAWDAHRDARRVVRVDKDEARLRLIDAISLTLLDIAESLHRIADAQKVESGT